MSRVVIFLAEGFEEIEALTPADFLRRAGIEVVLAGVGTLQPAGARGVRVAADTAVEKLKGNIDGVILPGGMPGSANLASSAAVAGLTKRVMSAGGMVASICAAPALALGSFGLLTGRKFTCYPGMEKEAPGGTFSADRVVVDGNLITSRGPGTAAEFSIAIIRYLAGNDAADKVAKAVLL
jgi:4-methyl-5(b-hydroxyethyl)-thiazole monophosphate biosynthesis